MPQPNEFGMDKLYQYAYALKSQGKNTEEVTQALMAQGIDEDQSRRISNEINRYYTRITVKTGKKNIVFGALWTIAGIIAFIITVASRPRGITAYVISLGMLILGISRFVRGIIQQVQGAKRR